MAIEKIFAIMENMDECFNKDFETLLDAADQYFWEYDLPAGKKRSLLATIKRILKKHGLTLDDYLEWCDA